LDNILVLFNLELLSDYRFQEYPSLYAWKEEEVIGDLQKHMAGGFLAWPLLCRMMCKEEFEG